MNHDHEFYRNHSSFVKADGKTIKYIPTDFYRAKPSLRFLNSVLEKHIGALN